MDIRSSLEGLKSLLGTSAPAPATTAQTKSGSTAGGSALTVQVVDPPAIAAGWNVYASYSPSGLTRQNDTPIALDQSWTEPSEGLQKGKPVGCGQRPEMFLRVTGVSSRG